jgi:putative glutamine amidotransferase
MNVYLGGKLEQHLADNPKRLEHDRDVPRAEPAHLANLKEGSLLAQVMGGVSVPINSHHHQGLDGAAPPLEEIGWAEDGVLEAVTSTDHTWVLGVQWHPEAMADTDKREKAIFDSFVTAAHRFSTADEGLRAQSA